MSEGWQPRSKLRVGLECMAMRAVAFEFLVVAAWRIHGPRAGQHMVPIALALVVVGELLLRRMLAAWDAQMMPTALSAEHLGAAMAKLRKWPAARAERRARAALADGDSIPHSTLADGDPPTQVATLAPALRAFFGEWSEVADDESSCLSWSVLGESELRPGRIRIGNSGEDNGEYSVAPGEEAVLYVERPYAAGSPEAEESFPTIWHVVCFMAGCVVEIAEKLEQADGQF